MKIDKSTWTDGPWMNEPDEVKWIDEDTGYSCEIHRNRGGALCGYVGLSESHPLFGVKSDNTHESTRALWEKSKDRPLGNNGIFPVFFSLINDEDDLPRLDVIFNVHGSLTYSREVDGLWFFGFDCSHCDDISPKSVMLSIELGYKGIYENQTYRDIEYVTNEVKSLARQLKDVELGTNISDCKIEGDKSDEEYHWAAHSFYNKNIFGCERSDEE